MESTKQPGVLQEMPDLSYQPPLAGRIALGLVVDVVLIGFFGEVCWVFLSPYTAPIRKILASINADSVKLVVLCAVLAIVAQQLVSVRSRLNRDAWSFIASRRRRVL